MKSTDFATSMRPWCSTVPEHLTSRLPRRSLIDCLPLAILDPVWLEKKKKVLTSTEHYFTTTPKFQTGCTRNPARTGKHHYCIGLWIGLLRILLSIITHLTPSISLLPIGLTLTRKIHVYWACVSTTQIHGLKILTCSSPSFTAALYISVISVDSGTLNRVLRICRLDEVEETDEWRRRWELRTYGRCYAQTRHPHKTQVELEA